jgi:G3E family GTPase
MDSQTMSAIFTDETVLQTSRSAGWLQALESSNVSKPGATEARKHEGSGKKVTSFVYTARKPFHPGVCMCVREI